MEPLITIITPTLNIVEKGQADDFNLLIKLLDMQTYPRIEHIIMDGGSTDGTIEMLKAYKNQKFFQFYSDRDTGKFNAINKGILRAKGKYLAFLSCDDFIHDITAITDIVSLMEDNEADFTFSPAYCRHPEGFTFLFAPSMHNAFQVFPCARQGMFFKKSFIEKMNYFDEKFKMLSDFDFIIRIMLKKARGVYFDSNYITYKLADKSYELPERAIEETKLVFFKNYKMIYPMNEDILDRMAYRSMFPKPLLEKLSTCFPPEDKEIFLEKCEQMHQLRMETAS